MARKKKAKKSPISIILLVLCSAIVLYFIISFVKLQSEINKKEEELAQNEAVLESRVAENEALEVAVSEGDENALAEEYARKKGYVMPDERVYVDVTPGEEE